MGAPEAETQASERERGEVGGGVGVLVAGEQGVFGGDKEGELEVEAVEEEGRGG